MTEDNKDSTSCDGYQNTPQGISRRLFLGGAVSAAALSVAMPGMALANLPTDKRLVVVVLRGGLDGLAAVVPYGDRNYALLREGMAFDKDVLLPLDDGFGLHPALADLHGIFKADQMAVIHAVASPYRKRSHFDAQNVLELGGTTPHSMKSGWLNRTVAALGSNNGKLGLSVGFGVPTILSGPQPVGAWAPSALPDLPEGFYERILKVYESDPSMQKALMEGLAFEDKVDGLYHKGKDRKMAGQTRSRKGFVSLAEMAGKLLADPTGPRIATLEMGGWDTHVNQGIVGGQLANNLALFGQGIAKLKQGLGGTWDKTVVLAMTEFGRTARPNGTRGTDHGTAGAAFILGGAVKGGRVVTEWPGLGAADLYQERDLKPTMDMRDVISDVLRGHFGLSQYIINHEILPDKSGTGRIGLIR